MTATTSARAGERVSIRPLTPSDLSAADDILRLAFNTFVGVSDLFGDADYVRTRFSAVPEAALAAELDGSLVGSNFLTRWGTFGFFGPLSVRPDVWDQGVAQRLLGPTVDLLDSWNVTDAGLFTFAHSAKHVSLYRRFGFWPQYLTFVMAAPVPPTRGSPRFTRLSEAAGDERPEILESCAHVAGTLLEGLDLTREIEAVHAQRLGETVLVDDGDGLAAFAVCHTGAGSEAGSGACYVKFGAARAGVGQPGRFARLLDACFAYAAEAGAEVVVAGCNAARIAACEALFARGFRTQLQGVAMQRGNRAGLNRADVYAIDDWR